MLDKKTVDLLNQEVDGTNSEKESIAVKKTLDRNAEARQLFQELKTLASLFKQVPQIDPPSYLKTKILNAVSHPPPPAQAKTSSLTSAFRSLAHDIRFRYAASVTGGAVVGILLFALFTNSPSDTTQFVGTMGSNVSEVRAPVTGDKALGSVAARYQQNIVSVEVSLESPGEVDVILNFDQSQLRFDSFRRLDTAEHTFSVLDGQVRSTSTGPATYAISFVNQTTTTPPVTVKIFSGGIAVYQRTLTVERQH